MALLFVPSLFLGHLQHSLGGHVAEGATHGGSENKEIVQRGCAEGRAGRSVRAGSSSLWRELMVSVSASGHASLQPSLGPSKEESPSSPHAVGTSPLPEGPAHHVGLLLVCAVVQEPPSLEGLAPSSIPVLALPLAGRG